MAAHLLRYNQFLPTQGMIGRVLLSIMKLIWQLLTIIMDLHTVQIQRYLSGMAALLLNIKLLQRLVAWTGKVLILKGRLI